MTLSHKTSLKSQQLISPGTYTGLINCCAFLEVPFNVDDSDTHSNDNDVGDDDNDDVGDNDDDVGDYDNDVDDDNDDGVGDDDNDDDVVDDDDDDVDDNDDDDVGDDDSDYVDDDDDDDDTLHQPLVLMTVKRMETVRVTFPAL